MRLAPNVDGSPHAMHGHGWQAAWQVIERDAASCALSFQHEPTPDWPWRYRGRQTIAVAGDALRLTLAIENLASTSMPCGLGFHPFLPRRADARLQFEAAQVWDGNAGAFPTATRRHSARRSIFATGRSSRTGREPITASTAGRAARRCATSRPRVHSCSRAARRRASSSSTSRRAPTISASSRSRTP